MILFEKLDEMTLTPSVRKKLSEGKESAENSRFLATICLTAPIDTDIEAYALHEVDNAAAACPVAQSDRNSVRVVGLKAVNVVLVLLYCRPEALLVGVIHIRDCLKGGGEGVDGAAAQ